MQAEQVYLETGETVAHNAAGQIMDEISDKVIEKLIKSEHI